MINLELIRGFAVETVKSQMAAVDAGDTKAGALQAASVLVLLFLLQARSTLALHPPLFYLAVLLLIGAVVVAMWAFQARDWKDYPTISDMMSLKASEQCVFAEEVIKSLQASILHNDSLLVERGKRLAWATMAFMAGLVVAVLSALIN